MVRIHLLETQIIDSVSSGCLCLNQLFRPFEPYRFFFSSALKLDAQSQELSSLENTVAALKEDYERSLSANAASQKDLQENLISAKHELLRVQEQLALAEKVCQCSSSGFFLMIYTNKHGRLVQQSARHSLC